MARRDDLVEEIGSLLIQGEVAQFVTDEECRLGVVFQLANQGVIYLGSQQVVEHIHGSGEEHTLIGLAGAPSDDFRQEGFADAWRTSHIMHITLRGSLSTTGGIRCSDKVFPYRSAKRIAMANTYLCACRTTLFAGCRNGCSVPNARSLSSALPSWRSMHCWNFVIC